MENILFFEGPIHIGKSTCLRNEINHKTSAFCGLSVVRVLENGCPVGYQAQTTLFSPAPPVDTNFTPTMSNLFLFKKKQEVRVLENAITKVQENAANPAIDFILLDEIGGIELLSPNFSNPLMQLLEGTVPIIGILKSRKNLERTASKLKLPNTYLEAWKNLSSLIQEKGQLIAVDESTLPLISEKTEQFLESFSH